MYTQCPECGTVFRVTAAVLRAAHGQVRCGVCDANFDALGALTDEVEAQAIAASSAGLAAETAGDPAAATETPADVTHATRNTASADEQRALEQIVAERAEPAAAAPAVPSDAAELSVEVNVLEPEDFEHIVLGGEAEDANRASDEAYEFDLPADEWESVFIAPSERPEVTPLDLNLAAAPDDEFDAAERPDEFLLIDDPAEPQDDSLDGIDEFQILASASAPEPVERPAPGETGSEPAFLGHARTLPYAAPAAAAASEPVQPHEDDFLTRAAVEPARRRGAGALPIAACALLALALAAQAVHFWREPLAEAALVGPALTQFYARIGAPLEPRWDVAAYEVHQWGAASEEAAGALSMRASVVNHAARPQPYPLLRVTLEDRFGGKVARREFAPAEYLPGRAPPAGLLAAGARADADLSLADPGSQAVGFELDVCLHRAGVLTCAADAKSAGGG